ncbi:unnamed protein product [Allacma fusca]|uniref:SCP domain-containing protein n=1 Tax=Allacma fusca TaxID=39272 RepID=A0A8J2PE36_9HEXA|nr:unnamed protein product [Allacma fusca]
MKLALAKAFLTLTWCAHIVNSEALKQKSREKRYIYIPLNIPLPNRPASQVATTTTTTTPAPAPAPGTPGGDQLPAASIDLDTSITLLINSFRTAHKAPPITYSWQLSDQAQTCADNRATASSLTTPTCVQNNQGESTGFSQLAEPAQGIREIITDPTSGWLAGYPGRAPIGSPSYWSNPTKLSNTEDYTQMIWVSTTQVGCGYSTDPAASLPEVSVTDARYIFVCLWTPAGNDDSTYTGNVLQDTE